MSVRKESRPVDVKTCDFCHKEVQTLGKCAICKRDMCSPGTREHTSHSLEVYSFKLENKICGAHVCVECAGKKFDLTLGQILDGMFGESPVPMISDTKGSDWLLESLMHLGFVTGKQVVHASMETELGQSTLDVLLKKKLVTEAQIMMAKAAQFGAQTIVLRGTTIEPLVIGSIPFHIAWKYKIIPVEKTEGRIVIAIADPSELNTIDTLGHLLNAEIEIRVAAEDDIEEAIKRYYPRLERIGGVRE